MKKKKNHVFHFKDLGMFNLKLTNFLKGRFTREKKVKFLKEIPFFLFIVLDMFL